MSMDVTLWATAELSLPHDLPEPDKWTGEWQYDGSAWLVGVEEGKDPFSEEILKPSSEITRLNDKATIPYLIHIEPIGADEQGYKFLQATIDALSSKCEGAVIEGPMPPQLI